MTDKLGFGPVQDMTKLNITHQFDKVEDIEFMINNQKPLVVLYHGGGCCDGFTAAWIAVKHIKERIREDYQNYAEFIPVNYGQDCDALGIPEKIKDKEVWVLDFSFPKEIMLRYHDLSRSIIVLDHHETAEKDCKDLEFCVFDMAHSGAYLTWKFLYGAQFPPSIVDYTQDRDLWTWLLPDSRAINAVIQNADKTFDNWTDLNRRIDSEEDFGEMLIEGETILKIEEKTIQDNIRYPVLMNIAGHIVPVVNINSKISESVGRLAVGQPFAASFFLRQDGKYIFSLRSSKDGLNVSDIAKQLGGGGGGHRHAAGFERLYWSTKLFEMFVNCSESIEDNFHGIKSLQKCGNLASLVCPINNRVYCSQHNPLKG